MDGNFSAVNDTHGVRSGKSKKVKWTNIWWYRCSAAKFHLRWHMVCVKSHLSTCTKSIFYLFCNHAKISYRFAHTNTQTIWSRCVSIFFFSVFVEINQYNKNLCAQKHQHCIEKSNSFADKNIWIIFSFGSHFEQLQPTTHLQTSAQRTYRWPDHYY